MHREKKLWIFATVLPGPRTGQTLTSEMIFERFMAAGSKCRHFAVVSRWGKPLPLLPHFVKALTTAIVGLRLRFVSKKAVVYYVPNATSGLWMDIIFKLLAGNRHQFVLHHQVASYLNKPSSISKYFFSLIPKDTVHLYSCECLAKLYEKTYGKAQYHVVPLSFMAQGMSPPVKPTEHKLFTIGHLSNLSEHKGVVRVLNLSRKLNDAGYKHRLVLAGPFQSPADEAAAQEAMKDNSSVTHIGPVYGKDKEAYYQSLDLFLFPTLYPNETWGIVVAEATATGVPSIVTEITCVGSQVPDEWVIPSNTNAETLSEALWAKTLEIYQLWKDAPDAYEGLRTKTRRHFENLNKTAQDKLDHLLTL